MTQSKQCLFGKVNLPSQVRPDSPCAQWLEGLGEATVIEMLQKDPDRPIASTTGAKLTLRSLVWGLCDRYETATEQLMEQLLQPGAQGRRSALEPLRQQRKELASFIRQLGFEPTFHIDDLAFLRRSSKLAKNFLEAAGDPARLAADSLRQLFEETVLLPACHSWQQGGIALVWDGYLTAPWTTKVGRYDHYFANPPPTGAATVTARKKQDSDRWGSCVQRGCIGLPLLSAIRSAESFHHLRLEWVDIPEFPIASLNYSVERDPTRSDDDDSKIGHAFVGLIGKPDIALPLDPSGIDYKLEADFAPIIDHHRAPGYLGALIGHMEAKIGYAARQRDYSPLLTMAQQMFRIAPRSHRAALEQRALDLMQIAITEDNPEACRYWYNIASGYHNQEPEI